jgi:hypothetical protein
MSHHRSNQIIVHEGTSQTRSLTCLMPTFCPANTLLRLIFCRLKQVDDQGAAAWQRRVLIISELTDHHLIFAMNHAILALDSLEERVNAGLRPLVLFHEIPIVIIEDNDPTRHYH